MQFLVIIDPFIGDVTQSHNDNAVMYLYSKTAPCTHKSKGTTEVLYLYLQHMQNVKEEAPGRKPAKILKPNGLPP